MSKKKQRLKKEQIKKDKNWGTYLRLSEKHLDKSLEKKDYAVKQFDTLMVALSTAGLGFISNYIKDIEVGTTLAVVAQLLFLSCLISNLLSHVFSMWANSAGYKRCTEEFKVDSYGEEHIPDFNEQTFYEKQAKLTYQIKIANIMVRTLNIFAFVALISAIVCFVRYTFIS